MQQEYIIESGVRAQYYYDIVDISKKKQD
jgi:hypothetical protein